MNPASMERLLKIREDLAGTSATMDATRLRFDALRGRHEDGTAPRAVVAFNLFQTPAEVAERMARIAYQHAPDAERILEPSAGLGRICKAIRRAWGENPPRLVMLDNSPDCCRELRGLAEGGDRVFELDFMETDAADIGGTFGAIVMNPPFKQGTDIKHIAHAEKMLAPGGVLVSLCYAGARQTAYLKPRVHSWELLDAGSFREAGTLADVALITILKRQKERR